ncbi:MAG: CBS domain-containing protein [Candidatus Desulfofervidaceae bacterium]|nr:CBS domain-containing protein [Candidatus Desulfofervidaceae bacterium]
MKVEEIMNKKLQTIEPDATVYDAIERLVDKRIRSLVIKPKDEVDVYGVITVRDIVFKVINKGLDIKKIKVKEIASKPLVSVSKDTDIKTLINLMATSNIARVFVFEEGEIIGIVSLLDILSASIIERAKERQCL